LRKSVRAAILQTAGRVPFVRPALQQVGQWLGQTPRIRDVYSREVPSPATPFTIFKNEWSSAVPGFETGKVGLFDDSRVKWLQAQLGSFEFKRVLELGPLEGGHTNMLERAGADVIAIEANQRAFLKCLVVKNALHLKSEFLYGDFRPYLEQTQPGAFDFVLAVGVLYHMLEPAKLLHDIARVTDSFGIWTHYYDAKIIGATPRFDPKPSAQIVEGKSVEVYKQNYLFTVKAPGFCGGSAPTSYWLTRNGLLDYVNALGFDVQVGEENLEHPAGPCILFFAKRRSR
jgi:SAM-dependent methyltransferase